MTEKAHRSISRLPHLYAALVMLMTMVMVPMAAAQTIYVMDSGDTVRVTVFGEPDLSGEFKVDAM
ncbi:MAG TPA: hypothetical protein DHW36_06690, partial [Thalassospira sp.]|nr:hypothetical protein [Thalassospira sp.]